MKLNHKLSRLEVQNSGALRALAESERQKKLDETRDARNKEAEARQWAMLQHYYEDPSGPCSKEAAIMLKRVLVHVNDQGEPDIDKMSTEERGFWYMFDAVFHCIEPEWLINNEIDYQLAKLLGEEGAQKFRGETTIDDRIQFMDEHLGLSWRAIQYDYSTPGKIEGSPEVYDNFFRTRDAMKEVVEGTWTGG